MSTPRRMGGGVSGRVIGASALALVGAAISACGGGGGGSSSSTGDDAKKVQFNTSSGDTKVELVTADGATTLATLQTDSDGELVVKQQTLDQALSDNGLSTDIDLVVRVTGANRLAVAYNNLAFSAQASEYRVNALTSGAADYLTRNGAIGSNESAWVGNVAKDVNGDGVKNTIDLAVLAPSNYSSYAQAIEQFVQDVRAGTISPSDSAYESALAALAGLTGPSVVASPSRDLTEGNTITIDTSQRVGSYGYDVSVTAAPSQVTTSVSGEAIDISLASGSVTTTTSGDLSYTVTDDNGDTATNTQTLNLVDSSDNEAPTADDFTYDNGGSAFNTAQTFNWNDLSNASDPNGDSLSASLDSAASHGSVTISANDVTYTPNDGYEGSDTFDLEIADGNGGNTVVTVTIDNIDTLVSAPSNFGLDNWTGSANGEVAYNGTNYQFTADGSISWDAVTDAAEYRLYANGSQLATVSSGTTSYTLSDTTFYDNLEVTAVDSLGNESSAASAGNVRVQSQVGLESLSGGFFALGTEQFENVAVGDRFIAFTKVGLSVTADFTKAKVTTVVNVKYTSEYDSSQGDIVGLIDEKEGQGFVEEPRVSGEKLRNLVSGENGVGYQIEVEVVDPAGNVDTRTYQHGDQL